MQVILAVTQGSVTGYTVTSNDNIDRNAPAQPATAGVQGGSGRKKSKRKNRSETNRSEKKAVAVAVAAVKEGGGMASTLMENQNLE